jgi:hypothetical protein
MSEFGGIKRKVFARHSNPWSAWTRWASTPLMFVPVWNRRWSQAALVAAWMALNPIVFPVPRHNRAWSTRAVLGEELWITERPRDKAMAVDAAASVAAAIALTAAGKRRLPPAALAIAAQMALTLGHWRLMAEYYERSQRNRDVPAADRAAR